MPFRAAQRRAKRHSTVEFIGLGLQTPSGAWLFCCKKINIKDLRDALGQYVWYADIFARIEPERTLYLAIRKMVFTNLFEEEPVGNILIENQRIRLIVFDPRR
jgi:hypothetical protein